MLRLVTTLVLFAAAAIAWPAPQRIISLSPSVTEILWGIGAFDRVVAVSTFCEYPEEVKGLPRVGGWTNTNLEQVVGLAPDIVILTDAQAPLVEGRLQALGFETLAVGSQSLADIFAAIESIGAAVGSPEGAAALSSEMHAELDAISKRTAGRGRPSVLCVVDRLPGTLRDLYVATEGSYLTDLVRIAGGDPITPPAPHNYAQISTEALVSFDPEVVLDMVQALAIPVAVGTSDLAEDPKAVWQTVPIRASRKPPGVSISRQATRASLTVRRKGGARDGKAPSPRSLRGGDAVSEILLQAENLVFSYGATPVIRDVSVAVPSGSFCGLIGPNGCGKSTLLRLLSGVLEPAHGNVRLEGRPLESILPRERAKAVAYVPQQQSRIFPFTAIEVVLTGRSPYTSRFRFEKRARPDPRSSGARVRRRRAFGDAADHGAFGRGAAARFRRARPRTAGEASSPGRACGGSRLEASRPVC